MRPSSNLDVGEILMSVAENNWFSSFKVNVSNNNDRSLTQSSLPFLAFDLRKASIKVFSNVRHAASHLKLTHCLVSSSAVSATRLA